MRLYRTSRSSSQLRATSEGEEPLQPFVLARLWIRHFSCPYVVILVGMTTMPPLTVLITRQVWSTSMSPSAAHMRQPLSTHSNLEISDSLRSVLDSLRARAGFVVPDTAVALVDLANCVARETAQTNRRASSALFIFCRLPGSRVSTLNEETRLPLPKRRQAGRAAVTCATHAVTAADCAAGFARRTRWQ